MVDRTGTTYGRQSSRPFWRFLEFGVLVQLIQLTLSFNGIVRNSREGVHNGHGGAIFIYTGPWWGNPLCSVDLGWIYDANDVVFPKLAAVRSREEAFCYGHDSLEYIVIAATGLPTLRMGRPHHTTAITTRPNFNNTLYS